MKILVKKNFKIKNYLDVMLVAKKNAKIRINLFLPDFPNLHEEAKWVILNTKKQEDKDNRNFIFVKIGKREYLISQLFTGGENHLTQFEKNVKSFLREKYPEDYI